MTMFIRQVSVLSLIAPFGAATGPQQWISFFDIPILNICWSSEGANFTATLKIF
ncbi:hypothetical protein CASFOL_024472 [Castilleja foliolosa]|uniref:Uncharacterized protein n=1 Tax=Castilleja foliolosa TaxID=1961234 RepID=A0ABD3CPB7_9LAMI